MLQRFLKRWQQIKTMILLRPVPHTVMSWRFLLPGQTKAVKLHRKVFLNAWPTLPRWAWALIVIYSSITWLFFFSWRQIFLALRRHSKKLKNQFNIPLTRQFLNLLNLAFVHAIPPNYYYQYNLFNQPKRKWLNYIYTFQLRQWHPVMSAGASIESQHLLSNKHDFAIAMEKAGLPAIKTITFIQKRQVITHEQLFTQRSLFLKPNIGNQRKGCFELNYSPEENQYTLHSSDIVHDEKRILDILNQQFLMQDYIIQPLLVNHPEITSLCNTCDLVTFRLVTGMIQNQPTIIFAIMEVPVAENKEFIWPLAIDPQTGIITNSTNAFPQHTEKRQTISQNLAGKIIPCWKQIVSTVLLAHQQIPDIPTIGWDVVSTPNGIKILEGNGGWAIAPPQILTSRPILDGILREVYSNQDNHH